MTNMQTLVQFKDCYVRQILAEVDHPLRHTYNDAVISDKDGPGGNEVTIYLPTEHLQNIMQHAALAKLPISGEYADEYLDTVAAQTLTQHPSNPGQMLHGITYNRTVLKRLLKAWIDVP